MPPTESEQAMIQPRDEEDRQRSWLRRRRALLVGLLIGLVSMSAGIAVGAATFPTTDALRRASAEEIGLDPDLLDHPLIEPVITRVSERIERRIVDEARRSMLLAVVTSAAVAVVGVAVVDRIEQRRHGDGRRDQAETRKPS